MDTVKQGSRGEAVYKLVGILRQLGYNYLIEGGDIFGKNTDKAVRDYQSKNQLVVDGIVGPLTWGKLLSLETPAEDPDPDINITGKLWIFGPNGYVNFRQNSGKYIKSINNGTVINTTGKTIGKYTEVEIDGIVGKVYTAYTRPYIEPAPDDSGIIYPNASHISKHITWDMLQLKCPDKCPEKYYPNVYTIADKYEQIYSMLSCMGYDMTVDFRSFYRSPKYNADVGGAPGSLHKTGSAIDYYFLNIPIKVQHEVAEMVIGNLGGIGKGSRVTHIDCRGYRSRWYY